MVTRHVRLTSSTFTVRPKAVAGCACSAATPLDRMSGDTTYAVKRVAYGAGVRPVLMQNENGPCPLLALANVLLLR